MEVNEAYLSSSKQQTLQVLWAVLGGGLAGRSFADLACELQLSEPTLLKELHNLAAAGFIEKRGGSHFWAQGASLIEHQQRALYRGIEIKLK